MAIPIPSAYGARITEVKRLRHPKDLVWHQITWTTKLGTTYTAKTLPGGDVNRLIENDLPTGRADIITNGRSQVLHIERAATDLMDEIVTKGNAWRSSGCPNHPFKPMGEEPPESIYCEECGATRGGFQHG